MHNDQSAVTGSSKKGAVGGSRRTDDSRTLQRIYRTNAKILFPGGSRDSPAVKFIKDTLAYTKKKHGINNKVKIVVSRPYQRVFGFGTFSDPKTLLNNILSDEGWDPNAKCKMIAIDHSLLHDHIGSVFVFHNEGGTRCAVFLNPNPIVGDSSLALDLWNMPTRNHALLTTQELQRGPGCWIFAARLLTDFYKCWVLASMDPNKVEDAELHDKILHAKKVHDAQLDLFQKAINSGRRGVELVPAFMKFRQSAKNLPEENTDVGILHQTRHRDFRKKNFIPFSKHMKSLELGHSDFLDSHTDQNEQRNSWVSRTLKKRSDKVPIPQGLDCEIY